MSTTANDTDKERSFTELAGLSALGTAFVLAGIGLFYGLAVDSMQVFTAALIVIFVLLAVSMLIIIRNEPLFSRENAILSVCIFVAMALYLGLSTFTTIPFAVSVGTLVFVGAVIPWLVFQYGDSVDSQ